MQSITVGLLGLGTVGSGVYEWIVENQQLLLEKTGCRVSVKKILVRNREKKRALENGRVLDDGAITTDASALLDDPDIDIIIEAMGGIETARRYLMTAFARKKHVVTANKDLIASYGKELLQTARENGCDFYFEASVAGGIPVIRALTDGLASEKVTKMIGIVNGTSNYILSKMARSGGSFQEILQEAQKQGFAEPDPSSDVNGLDAARKMAILSMLAFSADVSVDDVYVEGIEKMTVKDFEYAKRFGYAIKLLGLAQINGNHLEAAVQPTLIPVKHPLAAVEDEYNAVFIFGEATGETMFYGPGAGRKPTASAMISDLLAVIKNMRLGVCGKMTLSRPHREIRPAPAENILLKNYFRLNVQDEPGVFSRITSLFADHQISMEKIIQKPFRESQTAEIVIITHRTDRKTLDQVYKDLLELQVVNDVENRLRVEGCE